MLSISKNNSAFQFSAPYQTITSNSDFQIINNFFFISYNHLIIHSRKKSKLQNENLYEIVKKNYTFLLRQ